MSRESDALARELKISRARLDKLLKERERVKRSGGDIPLGLAVDIEEQRRHVQHLEAELTSARQPIITLEVQDDRLVLGQWSRLQLAMRNEGYGPAHNLVVRTGDDPFEGRTTDTDTVLILQVGHKETTGIDVRPHTYGNSVPLRLEVEYEDHAGKRQTCESTINLTVVLPPPPATTLVLSFDRLSPADFERLCLWLVELEGYTRGAHLGLAGNEQGRDVVAYKPHPQGEELWYFQCKRYRSISPKVLTDEVDKYLLLAQKKPHQRPTGVIFVVSSAVSAGVREQVGTYCKEHGLAYEFWALTELDMRVKRHPELLREFFNLSP